MPIGAIFGIGSTVAGVLGTAIGGSSQSGAIAAGEANALKAQQQNVQQVTSLEQPYTATGAAAENQLASLGGLNGSAARTNALTGFTADPSYQYTVQQGLSAIDNGAASQGLLQSGNTARAEETLGANLGSQQFSNYYNRLAGLAAGGQTATGQVASTVNNAANEESSLYASGANAQSGIAGNTASGIGTAAQSGINNLFHVGTPPAANTNLAPFGASAPTTSVAAPSDSLGF